MRRLAMNEWNRNEDDPAAPFPRNRADTGPAALSPRNRADAGPMAPFPRNRADTGPAALSPRNRADTVPVALSPRNRANPLRPGRALLLGTALLCGLSLRASGVAVSPVALYIDDRTRTGTLTLFNPGTRPEEIEVDFGFGYPQSDEAGNVTVPITETAPSGEPSAVEWLRAFPRRMVLQPGQRQVVRVVVQPPPGLAEGEYWGRVLIRSRGGQAPIEQQQGEVRMQIDVETVVVAALSYRNGGVGTGLTIREATAERADSTVLATIDLERTGNAAFIGRLLAEVLDADGDVVAASDEVLAVYYGIRRRMAVPVPAGTAGPLRVRFRIDTDRDDLPPGAPLPFDPIEHVTEVR